MSRSACKELKLSSKGLSSLPQALFRRTDLQRLFLDGNEVAAIPPAIAQLTKLAALDVLGNALAELPDELFRMTTLESVDLTRNRLTALPPAVASLRLLVSLHLSGNTQLGALPSELGSLPALAQLHADECGLAALPDALGDLPALASLSLAGNAFKEEPLCLRRMAALERLVLDRNALAALSQELLASAALRCVSVRRNRIEEAPRAPPFVRVCLEGNPCSDVAGDHVLELRSRRLKEWPGVSGENLGGYRAIALDWNRLVRLTAMVADAAAMEVLEVPHNSLTALPTVVFNMGAVRVLDLSRNRLATLPSEIGLLTSLEELYAPHNAVASVSDHFAFLERLRVLDLAANRLASVPDPVFALSALQHLRLAHNDISAVDASRFAAMSALAVLDLAGTPLNPMPTLPGVSVLGGAANARAPASTESACAQPLNASAVDSPARDAAAAAAAPASPALDSATDSEAELTPSRTPGRGDGDGAVPGLMLPSASNEGAEERKFKVGVSPRSPGRIFLPPPPEEDDDESEEEEEEVADATAVRVSPRRKFTASISMSMLPVVGDRAGMSPTTRKARTPSIGDIAGRCRTPSIGTSSIEDDSDSESPAATANDEHELDGRLDDDLGEETDVDLCSQGLTEFPEELLGRGTIEKLQLDMNALRCIPPGIGRLELLQELYLSDNKLEALPDEIGELSMLLILNVDNNCLCALPPSVGQLQSLVIFKVQGNRLTELPPEIGQLKHLKELNVSDNELTQLPQTMQHMVMLEKLVATDNQLKSIPKKLEKLPRLAVINTAGNPMGTVSKQSMEAAELDVNLDFVSFIQAGKSLTAVPNALYEQTDVELVKLSRNCISELSPQIARCTAIVELVLDNNQLTTLPPEIAALVNCRTLILDHNALASLPRVLFSMNLTQLSAKHNALTEMPPELGQLSALTLLALDHNQLEDMPDELGRLTALQLLSITHNQLTLLPESIGDCESLRGLLLDDNQLTELPIELIGLLSLQMLSVRNNLLAEVPADFGDLESLCTLHVEGNPLEGVLGLVADSLADVVAERDGLAGLVAELEEKLVVNGTELEQMRHTLEEEAEQHRKALEVLAQLQAENKKVGKAARQEMKRVAESEREGRRLIEIIDTAIRSKEVTIKTLQSVLLQLRVTLGEMDKRLSSDFKKQLGNIDKVILDEIKVQDKWIKAATNAKERRKKVSEALLSPRSKEMSRVRRGTGSMDVATIFELQRNKRAPSKSTVRTHKRGSELPLKTWGMRKMALDSAPPPLLTLDAAGGLDLQFVELDGGARRLASGSFEHVAVYSINFCPDTKIIASFYLCYRKYGSADSLFATLKQTFTEVPSAVASVHQYRLRVLYSLQHWVHAHHLHDFHDNKTLTNAVKNFLMSSSVEEDFPEWSKSMCRAMERLEEKSEKKASGLAAADGESSTPPKMSRRKSAKLVAQKSGLFKKIRKINLAAVKPKDLAEQLTLIEFEYFRNIDPVACVDAATRKSHPSIKSQVSWFNRVGRWVSYEIVSPAKMKTRAAMIKLFISTMIRCREMHNYNTLLQISAGMHLACVTRMHRTWEMVPRRLKDSLAELRELMDGHGNYRAYRDELAAARPPVLPYFGVCTRDLTFMDDGNEDTVEGRVNFDKMRLMGNVIQEVQKMQDVSYANIMPIEELQEHLSAIGEYNDNDLHKLSVQNEPKEDH